ncbi:S8 family peptidase [Pedobacter sp. GR22-6]|uniref:S8 family peptidase n=1 Tax=Pedobacter sp. GR22-6 TaxID=3127957 RepID=UPI00307DB21A
MRFKYILPFLFSLLVSFSASAQNKDVKLPPNWYNLDLLKDGYFGISTEKAYKELLNGKQAKQKVIVAVIDGGVDTKHEDLKDVLWVNQKEIAGNGIDDDGNGYVDDIHGWNFIGSKAGDVAYDNLELTRIRRTLMPKFISTTRMTVLDSADKEEFALYQKVTKEFGEKYNDAHASFAAISTINKILDSVALIVGKKIPALTDMDKYSPNGEEEEYYVKYITKGAKKDGMDKFYEEMKDAYKQYDVMLNYNLNMDYDPRAKLVGDNYADSKERIYGNSDVTGPNADHGSHVSGIIAAKRDNGIGINGIADNVSIMAIRVVPEGDERDKDVANGIRYAVDNGAKVINMSFGKGFKWDKKIVDESVKYAEQKGVLLVHAAGNDNENNDVKDNFPNKYYETPEAIAYEKQKKASDLKALLDKAKEAQQRNNNSMYGSMGRGPMSSTIKPKPIDTTKFSFPHATNWIEVGASAYKNDGDLKASFSNYGKYTVDVYAPGFMINSTIPGSKYKEFDGTSMAAPVVSGLAAMILSYYPDLKPNEVREIIMKSVVKVVQKVKYKNERGETVKVPFSELCRSGGIVNAFQAIKLAATYTK